MVSMLAAHIGRHTALFEPLDGVLANRLEHPEAALGVPDEALLDQRLERVQVGPGDIFGGLDRAAAGEDAERGEEPLLVGRQEVVAPGDRRAERLLARVGVAAAAEEVETLRQPLQDLSRRENRRARR